MSKDISKILAFIKRYRRLANDGMESMIDANRKAKKTLFSDGGINRAYGEVLATENIETYIKFNFASKKK